MADDKIQELTEELRQFQEEKEKIRCVVGQIGGKVSGRREKIITIVFVILLIFLFGADIAIHMFDLTLPLPPLFSVCVGILLVSLKIIWMIHNQTRMEHFQFWILNSIEFRIDQIAKRLRDLETGLNGNTDG